MAITYWELTKSGFSKKNERKAKYKRNKCENKATPRSDMFVYMLSKKEKAEEKTEEVKADFFIYNHVIAKSLKKTVAIS